MIETASAQPGAERCPLCGKALKRGERRMSKYIDELMAMAELAEKIGDRKMAEDCRRTAKHLLDYLCYIEQAQGGTL
ncbi:MAG: hypothetical protein J6V72_10075 [Kiritimatiellae bacterium]|nr:hypothetical protein [Kiritimatiellia bacterium]